MKKRHSRYCYRLCRFFQGNKIPLEPLLFLLFFSYGGEGGRTNLCHLTYSLTNHYILYYSPKLQHLWIVQDVHLKTSTNHYQNHSRHALNHFYYLFSTRNEVSLKICYPMSRLTFFAYYSVLCIPFIRKLPIIFSNCHCFSK